MLNGVLKGCACDCTTQHQARTQTSNGQRTDRGGVHRSIARSLGRGSLSFGGASIAWGEVEIAAKLVKDDEIGSIDVLLLNSKEQASPDVAFRGDQGLFLRVQPRRAIARPRVQRLREVP